jgi:hypothetical protein
MQFPYFTSKHLSPASVKSLKNNSKSTSFHSQLVKYKVAMQTKIIGIILLLTWASHLKAQMGKDPFTGLTIINKGIHYEKAVIETQEGLLFSNEIALGIPIVIKLYKPTGFKTLNGNIHLGTEYAIYDSENNEILKTDDIYEEDMQGLPQAFVEALTFTFIPEEPLEAKQDYYLKIRFFDKKSDAHILAILRMKITEKSKTTQNLHSSISQFEPGYKVLSQALSFAKAEIKSQDKPLQTLKVHSGTSLSFHLQGVAGFKAQNGLFKLLYSYTLTNDKGEEIHGKELEHPHQGEIKDIHDFTVVTDLVQGMNPGQYLWTVKIWNLYGNEQIGASIPLNVM